MLDQNSEIREAPEARSSWRGFLVTNWPYLAMLISAIAGVAYTSVARQAITAYWITLAPFFAAICMFTRWREDEGREVGWRLFRTEVLHWAAVVFAMYLVFVADVRQMMNADASALMVLIILALGTLTAGIHIDSWRISLVGVVLGLGAPAIAWLEISTLLILLVAVALIALALALFFNGARTLPGRRPGEL